MDGFSCYDCSYCLTISDDSAVTSYIPAMWNFVQFCRDFGPPLGTPAERDAVNILGLVAPVTITDVKQRYKILVKELHPDANGGDKRAEDRLKSVNNAYKTLRDCERLM